MAQKILELEITANTEKLKKGLEESKKALRDFNAEVTKSGGFKNALEAERLEGLKLANQIKANRLELSNLTLEKRKNQTQTEVLSGSYREAQQRLTALGKSIREAKGGFENTSPEIRKQIQDYNELNGKLKDFDRAMGNNYRNVGNYGSALLSTIPVVGQFTSSLGVAGAAYNALQNSFSTNLKIDSLNTALRNVSGTAENFTANIDFLKQVSNRLGLEFISTAEAFKQWQGAAKFSNLTSEESRSIFESVANASAKMKLSSEDVKGSFLALSQIMSKGKVQAEELRGQLGERLPGAFALAAKAMGVTEQELNKMLERGEVVANDFLPKFAKQLDISFGNDKTEKIESMQASVNKLKNTFTELYQSDSATSFFTAIVDGTNEVVKSLSKINEPPKQGSLLALFLGGGNKGIGMSVKQQADDLIRSIYSISQPQALTRGFNPFGNNNTKEANIIPKSALYEYKYVKEATKEISKDAEKNKSYWEDQVKSLKASREALSSNEIGTKKWLELTKQLRIAQDNVNLYDFSKKEKSAGKSQEDIIKSVQNSLESSQVRTLRGIDDNLLKIDLKWDSILRNIDKIGNVSLKNAFKEQVKLGRETEKTLLAIDNFAKSKDIRGLTGKNSGIGLSGSLTVPNQLPNLANNQYIVNARQRYNNSAKINDDDAKLENRISKVVESGFRQGISGVLGDITNLGSNFQQVFTNVFNQLAQSMSSILNNVVGTYLGDLFKKKLDSVDFAGLGNKASKAIIAGLGTAGTLVSGLAPKTSGVGQAIGGALSGVGAGMTFGPVGAAIGGAVGLISGIFSAKRARKEREIQEAQLREQQKQTRLQERIAQLTYTSSITGQVTNQGTVTAIDRDALGNIIGRIEGKDIVLVVDRTRSGS